MSTTLEAQNILFLIKSNARLLYGPYYTYDVALSCDPSHKGPYNNQNVVAILLAYGSDGRAKALHMRTSKGEGGEGVLQPRADTVLSGLLLWSMEEVGKKFGTSREGEKDWLEE
jgi:hypothetical protein